MRDGATKMARRIEVDVQPTAGSAADMTNMDKKVDDLRREVAEAFHKVTAALNGHAVDIATLTTDRDRIDGEIFEMNEDWVEVKGKIENQHRDIIQLGATIHDAGLNDFVLKTKLNDMTTKIEEAFTKIQENVTRAEESKAAFDKLVVESGSNLKNEVDSMDKRVNKLEVQHDMAKQFMGKAAAAAMQASSATSATPTSMPSAACGPSLRGNMEFDQLEGLYHEMHEAVVNQNQAIEHLQTAVIGPQETPKVLQEPSMGPGPTVGGQTVNGKPDSSGCHCPHVSELCIEMVAVQSRVTSIEQHFNTLNRMGMAANEVNPEPPAPVMEDAWQEYRRQHPQGVGPQGVGHPPGMGHASTTPQPSAPAPPWQQPQWQQQQQPAAAHGS